MTLEEAVNYRRSVRHYKNIPLDTEKVKHCIELATLALLSVASKCSAQFSTTSG